jgi:6-phosphogluconolactonase
VAQFDVDPTSGALTPKARPIVGAGPGPFPVAVTPSGRFAYVGFQNGVVFFSIDPASGGLTRRGSVGVPRNRFPAVSALAVTSRNLYGAFQGGAAGGVVQYRLTSPTGRPVPLEPATPPSGFAPNDVAVG